MAKVSVYNMEGQQVGEMDLNDAVFGVEVNEHLVKMAVVSQLANKRQGTQKAKTRSEVSGGGRKPWRQKGTGHARQGSTRAPPVSYTHLAGVSYKRYVREFRLENAEEYSVKDEIKADKMCIRDRADGMPEKFPVRIY